MRLLVIPFLIALSGCNCSSKKPDDGGPPAGAGGRAAPLPVGKAGADDIESNFPGARRAGMRIMSLTPGMRRDEVEELIGLPLHGKYVYNALGGTPTNRSYYDEEYYAYLTFPPGSPRETGVYVVGIEFDKNPTGEDVLVKNLGIQEPN